MNRIQEAIQSLTGVREVLQENSELQSTLEDQEQTFTSQYAELVEAIEHLDAQNALFQRQLEDIDYLNLFDTNEITEVISSATRKHTILRLRRLRHENPLAKQAIKLITRFTLGKGIELVIGPDPEKKQPLPPLVDAGASPSGSPKPGANGLYPDNQPPKNGKAPDLANRPRPQVAKEAVSNLPPQTGTTPLSDIGDDQLKEQIQEAWKDDDNQLALTSRSSMIEWIDNVATDGERFFVGFQASAAPYVKLTSIPLEQVETIIYDPDNWRKPVYYRRSWMEMKFDGESGQYIPKSGQPTIKYYLDWRITPEELPELQKKITIPAGQRADDNVRIWHTYINPLWTKKGCRGISELYSSREWFRVYKEFMEDRAAINAAATSVAYRRKIKGGPTAVAAMQGKFGGLNVGYDNPNLPTEPSRLARPSPGSTYDSNAAVDLEWMKTDTGAVNAKEDGRSLLTAGGAGVGMFVHYFGDGGDSNLATAQAMELPMVKTFEDWQQWTEDRLRELCQWIIREATDNENAKKQVDRIAGSFPPIISQDVVKYMTAWSQLTQNVASGNRVVKREAIKGALAVMDVPNVDSLMAEIDAEEVQLEAQRQAQHQAMVDALSNGLDNQNGNGSGNGTGNGDGKGLAARDGSSSSLPPDLKTIAKGKPPPARAGPKSAQ